LPIWCSDHADHQEYPKLTVSFLLESGLVPSPTPSETETGTETACRTGAIGALGVFAATALSGPGAMLLVELIHPQPPWRDARRFAEELHPVQSAPYFFGFFLTGSFIVLLASLHTIAPRPKKPRLLASVVLGGVAASMVFHNYVLQTTFVPELARAYRADHAPLIAAFSMVNPTSLAWALEMWGYGVLGAATWLAAPVFGRSGLEGAARWGFVANGWMSIAGALVTAVDPAWVFRASGLALFAAWNVLLLGVMGLTWAALRRRARVAIRP
jgi:hypothetical protein